MRRWLDVVLIGLAIASAGNLVLANDDPFIRDAICASMGGCIVSDHAKAWNKIFYDLSAGALVSLFFYLLMVRIPENEKRRRYRRNLIQQYRTFREECIELMLLVADGAYGGGTPETLLDQTAFRAYFGEKVTADQTRWDQFCNNLDEYHRKEIGKRLEIFRDEIVFILNNVDIPSDEPFAFLKRLSTALYSIQDSTLEYDDVKRFSRFLWGLFTGFDFVTGYPERDIVGEMIDAI